MSLHTVLSSCDPTLSHKRIAQDTVTNYLHSPCLPGIYSYSSGQYGNALHHYKINLEIVKTLLLTHS